MNLNLISDFASLTLFDVLEALYKTLEIVITYLKVEISANIKIIVQ